MYKTIFAFRDGNDITFKYEDYYKARAYTIDLADWRFGCCGEVVSLGKLVSMIPKDDPSELLYGRIEEINVLDGMIRITVFDSNISDTWISIEKFA